MLNLPSLFLLACVQYTFTRTVLSSPYLASRDTTGNQLNLLRHFPLPITLHPLNITHIVKDSGIEYHVKDSLTTLFFHLGFPCKEAGMRKTIISARAYCEQELEQGGDDPLPRRQDPFQEDLGYGVAINVVSARPDHRLTWGILKDVMDGLWEFLIVEGRYVESEFKICHGSLNLVGRGTISETPKTGFGGESQKRESGDGRAQLFQI